MLGKCIYKCFVSSRVNYRRLSYILSGSLRQKVVKALVKPKTPAQLTKEIGTQDSSVSRTLKELEKEKIIECLFPEKKKGRIYRLTVEGQTLLKRLI